MTSLNSSTNIIFSSPYRSFTTTCKFIYWFSKVTLHTAAALQFDKLKTSTGLLKLRKRLGDISRQQILTQEEYLTWNLLATKISKEFSYSFKIALTLTGYIRHCTIACINSTLDREREWQKKLICDLSSDAQSLPESDLASTLRNVLSSSLTMGQNELEYLAQASFFKLVLEIIHRLDDTMCSAEIDCLTRKYWTSLKDVACDKHTSLLWPAFSGKDKTSYS